ncbi:M23 family metallopeptidase [Leifsonia sp. Root112D2]|uniref:M23 family metallopeptidase n=1 Tax=Leifsonia sp. Root112D2 TaxID=1736426 RepID=UPI000ACAE665|nr:M23 family metallopeptidase [Leifsonia sp. Root112D2]
MPENPVESDAIVSADPGRVTPISVNPDAAAADRPLTRRELRERERAAEAAANTAIRPVAAVAPPASSHGAGASVAASPATARPTADAPALVRALTHRMPPLGSPAASAPATVPRRHRKRVWFARGVSLLAMTFAVAMAIATSIPANALVSHETVLAQATAAREVPAAKVDPQSITSGGDVIAAPVTRDSYEVTSLEQLVVLSHMRIADTFTNDARGTIQWPFPVGVPIADYYGPRSAPTEGASSFHQGVDFDPGYGTPIQIIADGTVREVHPYNDSALGVHVIIDHLIDGKLVSSLYGHMAPGSIRVVQGQKVKVADIVGEVGSTGISTGPHLHFEILQGGTTPVDPFAWLTAHAN